MLGQGYRFFRWGIWSVMLAGLWGCGDRNESPTDLESQVPEIPEITMILPGQYTQDNTAYQQAAMDEAGRFRVVFSVERPKETDPPERQAELVRTAVDRGVRAVIVADGDRQLLEPVLQSARDRGVAVVEIGRNIGLSGEHVTRVVAPETKDLSKQLVQVLVQTARENDLPAEGPALLLRPDDLDERFEARLATLRAALTEAGVSVLPDLVIESSDKNARRTLKAAIAAAPELEPRMVFGVNHAGMEAAFEVRALRLRHNRPGFLVAGFDDDTDGSMGIRSGLFNALFMPRPKRLAAEAVDAAVKLVQGESTAPEIVVALPMERTGVAPSGVLALPMMIEDENDPSDF